MKIETKIYSEIGSRPENEDSIRVKNENGILLAVIADGLGGHGRGKEASQIAVQTVMQKIDSSTEFSEDSLEDAIIFANRVICNEQKNESEMKTTVAALWIKGNYAIVSNIGDSRVYRIRNGVIDFHTDDHSKAYIAYQFGEIKYDQIAAHPDQNKLTRCLGSNQCVSLDTSVIDVISDDIFILCSDGFWELLSCKEIEDIVCSSENLNQLFNRFCQKVLYSTRANRDNCTFAIVTVVN